MKPKVVCLCGSTRFLQPFLEANCRETLKGNIVLSVGCFIHAMEGAYGVELTLTPGQKLMLDELHLRKIDLSDEVLILNVHGYVGDTVREEIEYAYQQGKPVRWLEPDKAPSNLALPTKTPTTP